MARKTSSKVITVDAVRRAFTSALRSPELVENAIREFMGDSPVPPQWQYIGLRMVFGVRVARKWARHLRHLHPASYKPPGSDRYVYPCVQTFAELKHAFPPGPQGKPSEKSLFLDEAHLLWKR